MSPEEHRLKTEEDLEFHKVRMLAAEHCSTRSGTEHVLHVHPWQEVEPLRFELMCVQEHVHALTQLPVPALQGEEIQAEVDLLATQGAVLEADGFLKIGHLCKAVHYLLKFLEKQYEVYPHLHERRKHIPIHTEVPEAIDAVLDRHGQVKSTASRELAAIRKKLGELRKQVERQFIGELARYRQAGFLDDTRETYLNGRRVLAVLAEYKRRIRGTVLGSSQSGKLAYIEPEATIPLNNEIGFLEQEERDEIHRILKELSASLRDHREYLQRMQDVLVDDDVLRAKAHFGQRLNGVVPEISPSPRLELYQAFHPLLWLKNRAEKLPTEAHDLVLDPEQRILVISGPNAGGKSITLKTAGLLQWMFQSGFLIPVQARSKLSLFRHVLTDIGDNQSIENKLSTYSYRLQNMKYFLDVADARSLFLIDEFGTGSDPELGGALAEVFFEALYERKALGIMTTHYANIKVLADRLPGAINASMLFDRDSLEPLFQLSIGQPGSSFTFEVAQKNRIPLALIQEARNRVDAGKLKLDESIASLQREKGLLSEEIERLQTEKRSASEKGADFDYRREEYEFKLMRLQQTQRENNQLIQYGKRLQEFREAYSGKNLKQVIARFVKWLKVEHTKFQAPAPSKPKKETLASIPKEKKKRSSKEPKSRKPDQPLVPGDRVVLEGGTEVGELLEIKDRKAVVLFGSMKTQTDVKKLRIPAAQE